MTGIDLNFMDSRSKAPPARRKGLERFYWQCLAGFSFLYGKLVDFGGNVLLILLMAAFHKNQQQQRQNKDDGHHPENIAVG